MSNEEKNQTIDVAEVVCAFKCATKKLLRRMYENKQFATSMYGTEVYSSLLTAYAASLGKTLSGAKIEPSLEPVESIWNELHGL